LTFRRNLNGVTVESGQPFVSRNNTSFGRGLIIYTKLNGRELIPESSSATNRGGPRFVPVRQNSKFSLKSN
jgi:hypothetical protein